ncbi:MAG TPA: hypothetical protein DEB71_18500 [Chryseobacterium carnipullorum]|nr:hypothetical protein [Chryseobacterium carnipullorum]
MATLLTAGRIVNVHLEGLVRWMMTGIREDVFPQAAAVEILAVADVILLLFVKNNLFNRHSSEVPSSDFFCFSVKKEILVKASVLFIK